MALSVAELELETGAVLVTRDTMSVISLVTSRIQANSVFASLINRAAGNSVTGAAGATISVSQSVTQAVG